LVNRLIFALKSGGMVRVRAAEQDVRLDPDGPQLLDAVLGRLGLQLARGADVGHEGQVDEDRIGRAQHQAHLPDGLEERLALDIADRAPDLDDDDMVPVGYRFDGGPDLIGHVRDDLTVFLEYCSSSFGGWTRTAGCPVVRATSASTNAHGRSSGFGGRRR
jgi:hypothetical protein